MTNANSGIKPPRQILAEMIAHLDGKDPTPADKERLWELIEEMSRDIPWRTHLEQSIQLVESVESPSRPLEPDERAHLIASLTQAGDKKIGLFAAMRKLGKGI